MVGVVAAVFGRQKSPLLPKMPENAGLRRQKNYRFFLLQKIQQGAKLAETCAATAFGGCNKVFKIHNLLQFVTPCYNFDLYRFVTDLLPCYTLKI